MFFDLGHNDIKQYLEKSAKLNLETAEGNNEVFPRNEIESVFDELSAQFDRGSQGENSLFSQLLDEHELRRVGSKY